MDDDEIVMFGLRDILLLSLIVLNVILNFYLSMMMARLESCPSVTDERTFRFFGTGWFSTNMFGWVEL